MAKYEDEVKNNMFGFGDLNEAYGKYFTGDSFAKGLVPSEGNIDFNVVNVNFAPGVRNNWHIHHDGYQIIMVTAGEGWSQIEGEEPRSLKAGDVVVFKDGVKHWHGAKKGSWFSHLAITKGTTEWLEPVSDADYDKLPE